MARLMLIFCSLGLWASVSFAQDFKITVMKTSIAEEMFQTFIVTEGLKELGYKVEPVQEVDYAVAYKIIAQHAKSNDVYLTTSNWTPIHDNMEKGVGLENLYKKGFLVRDCASGYMMDKKTADKYNIKYLSDLKDPKIAKLFDSDGDGKADLTGCNPGWECEKVINHQIEVFGLKDVVEQNSGKYSAIIAETMTKFDQGEPVVFFAWVPYWMSGKLVPGRDVIWLEVKKSAHPFGTDTELPNGKNYGFNVSTQHIVANASVATKHPDIAKFFELVEVPVNDISMQNLLMMQGEKKESDVRKHTASWIKANRKTFDSWIAEARKAK